MLIFFNAGFSFIVKLSQRIHVRSHIGWTGAKETEYFHRTFPFFIWLLRDVTQSIPNDCRNIKDYFLKKVGLKMSGKRYMFENLALRIKPTFVRIRGMFLEAPGSYRAR